VVVLKDTKFITEKITIQRLWRFQESVPPFFA
jgi:hypothetical protein